MFTTFLRVLLFFPLVSPLVAMGAETEDPDTLLIDETEIVGKVTETEVLPPPEPVIIKSFVYNDEQVAVQYSNGTQIIRTAEKMGYRALYAYCRNLSRPVGKPPYVVPGKYIVGWVRLDDKVITTTMQGVQPSGEVGDVAVEVKVEDASEVAATAEPTPETNQVE